ncbi:MAG: DUF1616 domain-containing protein [Halobacteriota archaeon]
MEIVLSALRLVIGAALFFFIPGSILTVLLFPRKQDLYVLERALIAVITSIIVSMADATFLLVTVGLNFVTLMFSMLVLSAVFVVLAFARLRTIAQSDRLAINGKGNSMLLPAIAGTICLVLALSGVTLLFYPHSNAVSYSEFYILDSNRQTVAYPTNVTQGTSSALIIGITNHEKNANTYSGTVSLNNSTLYSFDNLTLSSGQNVEKPIVVSFNSSGQKQKLQFTLTDSLNKTYELHLWVNVSESV